MKRRKEKLMKENWYVSWPRLLHMRIIDSLSKKDKHILLRDDKLYMA